MYTSTKNYRRTEPGTAPGKSGKLHQKHLHFTKLMLEEIPGRKPLPGISKKCLALH
ncbi:hypothetical protein P378_13705 [Desulforamulus profundi]|uniref:Uncharacterized protein n=1 Tax=Desulforamulus profundi TaxID=1383067 RepID=A0A2C6MCP2_9FIRM|nr:hypothetical protein P378_13705 [Desulforamulus profundi]